MTHSIASDIRSSLTDLSDTVEDVSSSYMQTSQPRSLGTCENLLLHHNAYMQLTSKKVRLDRIPTRVFELFAQ